MQSGATGSLVVAEVLGSGSCSCFCCCLHCLSPGQFVCRAEWPQLQNDFEHDATGGVGRTGRGEHSYNSSCNMPLIGCKTALPMTDVYWKRINYDKQQFNNYCLHSQIKMASICIEVDIDEANATTLACFSITAEFSYFFQVNCRYRNISLALISENGTTKD